VRVIITGALQRPQTRRNWDKVGRHTMVPGAQLQLQSSRLTYPASRRLPCDHKKRGFAGGERVWVEELLATGVATSISFSGNFVRRSWWLGASCCSTAAEPQV
jgi:hypothetical protein